MNPTRLVSREEGLREVIQLSDEELERLIAPHQATTADRSGGSGTRG